MQERGPSLRVLVITCKVHMWHTHGVRETSCPSKRERMNYIVQSILGLVELLNIKELLHYNWKFCIPPNAMWLCFMFCICLIRTQDFVVEIQLWNELWFTSPCTLLELRYLCMLISFQCLELMLLSACQTVWRFLSSTRYFASPCWVLAIRCLVLT